ncbi:hypothetical protein BDY21DRAFT_371349 [Lineolata rhizophorae]|uniref:TOM core complex subunit Tom6 n=1 Tax=Lineolata rhizophorae TaxID=578093 RepID=A0A6A6P1U7_9PEZI|nr:hypothetical protein BDY21DRAFT_371349 [Lineolata rhizophorae]
MPAGRPLVGRNSQQSESTFKTVVNGITSSENRTVVTAVGLFAVGVAFLHSSWSEILLP